MRTPAGKECKYFFGDYYRGRDREECRLLRAAGQRWSRDLCATCPVPGILQANACEFIQLRASVIRSAGAFFQRRVHVSAYCEKVQRDVAEPHIGCGQCHPLPPEFSVRK